MSGVTFHRIAGTTSWQAYLSNNRYFCIIEETDDNKYDNQFSADRSRKGLQVQKEVLSPEGRQEAGRGASRDHAKIRIYALFQAIFWFSNEFS